MTVASHSHESRHLLQLLAHSDQLVEWRERIERAQADGRRFAVAYGGDRRDEAAQLTAALAARTAPLSDLPSLGAQLGRGDLLLAVTSAGAGKPSLQAVGALAALERLVHSGIIVWGLTGPRPNPISPYCHDSLAVPESDPSVLHDIHRLVVRRLAGKRPAQAVVPHRIDRNSHP